jgi:hypothetical protein
MAIEKMFVWLAVFVWMALGAAIVLAFWALSERRRAGQAPEYAPYAELLGKPCWVNEGGEYSKFRIVAVSHKGAMAIRRWEDTSGKGAKWLRAKDVKPGFVYFEEPGQ